MSNIVSNVESRRIDRFLRRTNALQTPQPTSNMNTILIVCDEMINYNIMPEDLRNSLPGFQAFRRLGIEFTNIHNNRQDCSPSRASLQSSEINIGIGDNIDQPMQYPYVPQLGLQFDTIGTEMSGNGISTAYYGKNHFVSSVSTDVYTTPLLNTNTRGCLKQYGFDVFNTYGDTYYYQNRGFLGDDMMFNFEVNNKTPVSDVDYTDHTGKKFVGVLPYLKARAEDKKPFHLQSHFINPHDTMHFWQNFGQTPTKGQLQYWAPYINEQVAELKKNNPFSSAKNPYYFDALFPNAHVTPPNLTTNYFEKTYAEYIENEFTLPFIESYKKDYASNPSDNSLFPFFAGMSKSFSNNFTFPDNSQDFKSWKNLINNYYGLIIESDFYIFQIFRQLLVTGMLQNTSVMIVSDHGDMMSAHGLKQKGYHFRESSNVCCVAYSPFINTSLKGTKNSILGSLIDIAPTFGIMANTSTRSSKFKGVSLLNWSNMTLIPRTQDIPVFNTVYSWMNAATYIYFKQWYKSQPTSIQNKIATGYEKPDFYTYINFYTMIIKKITDEFGVQKQYKLARYYNFIEILEYNFVVNEQVSSTITSSTIMKYIPPQIQYNNLFVPHISVLYNQINTYLTANSKTTFGFSEMYNELRASNIIGSKTDSIIVDLFISSISAYIVDIIGMDLLIPGYMSKIIPGFPDLSFDTLYNDPDRHYFYFLHNMTDDPTESVNLLDKAFPSRQTIGVLEKANRLNEGLNELIDTYDIRKFQTVIPVNVMVSVLLSLNEFGEDVTKYTSAQTYEMASFSGQNNMDSPSNNISSITYSGTTLNNPRIDFYDYGNLYTYGISDISSTEFTLTGVSSDNGFIYVGTPDNLSIGTTTLIGLSGGTNTAIYGSQYNTSSHYIVGGVTIGNNRVGFFYDGTVSNMNNTSAYTTIIKDTNAFTTMHDIKYPIAIGNTSTTITSHANAVIYNISTSAFTSIVYPGASTTVVYGIYDNGGSIYTIVGGYSSDTINSNNIYIQVSNTGATYLKPIGYSFIADYDLNANTFSNWTTYTHDSGSKTHFTGIDINHSIQSNVYNISGTIVDNDNIVTGLLVRICRMENNDFSIFPQTHGIQYISEGDRSSINTCSSISKQFIVGGASKSGGDYVGYMCETYISK